MEAYPLTIFNFALLFITGFCAGFVDSIAGGGGLISLPVLLSIGLPPQVALGTNKLQASFGSLTASWNYVQKGEASLKDSWNGILFTLIGAVIGSWTIQHLEADFLRLLIPILLLLVFFYTLLSKNLGFEERKAILSPKTFYILFGLALGFYDGFFGPGTGSFWTAAFMVLLGFKMTRAAGHTKIMNFTSNIVALILFIIGGNVLYSVGLCMAFGQLLGARAGSSAAIKNGAGFIRPVFLTVVFLTILRLLCTN